MFLVLLSHWRRAIVSATQSVCTTVDFCFQFLFFPNNIITFASASFPGNGATTAIGNGTAVPKSNAIKLIICGSFGVRHTRPREKLLHAVGALALLHFIYSTNSTRFTHFYYVFDVLFDGLFSFVCSMCSQFTIHHRVRERMRRERERAIFIVWWMNEYPSPAGAYRMHKLVYVKRIQDHGTSEAARETWYLCHHVASIQMRIHVVHEVTKWMCRWKMEKFRPQFDLYFIRIIEWMKLIRNAHRISTTERNTAEGKNMILLRRVVLWCVCVCDGNGDAGNDKGKLWKWN